MTHFPYNHGDALEHAREKARAHMHEEMKIKAIELEMKEREKLGPEKYEAIKEKIDKKDRESIAYPQGCTKQVDLQDQFQQ